jgi:hypothetical protein
MLDMWEIGRAFVLACFGTVLVVALFTLLIKAHPIGESALILEDPRAASAARPSRLLALPQESDRTLIGSQSTQRRMGGARSRNP